MKIAQQSTIEITRDAALAWENEAARLHRKAVACIAAARGAADTARRLRSQYRQELDALLSDPPGDPGA